MQHKDDAQPKKANKGQIRYILDVDDTLTATGYDGYNEEIIKGLKEQDVTHVTLLTKMDAKKLSRSAPLRCALIDYLEEQGITVDRVLTPLDLLYREAGVDLQPGDAYKIYMRPVELAIAKAKQIPEKAFYAYKAFHYDRPAMLAAMRYLRDTGYVQGDQLISGFLDENGYPNKKLEDLQKALECDDLFTKNYIEGYGQDPQDLDYEMLGFQVFSNHFTKRNEALTFDQLIEQYQEEIKLLEGDQLESRSSLTEEQRKNIEIFCSELKKYRNFNYHVNLLVLKKQEEHEAVIAVSKKYSKGEEYAWYVETNPCNPEDVDIFMDDNKAEHASLKEAHAKYGFKHSLITLLPPYSPIFYLGDENVTGYRCLIQLQHLRMNLINYANQYPTKKSLLKNHITYLHNQGATEAEKGNLVGAITYFKLAYLLCNENIKDDPDMMKFLQETKNKVFHDIIKARKEIKELEKDGGQVKFADNIFIDSLLKDVSRAIGFVAEIKMVQLNLEIHKREYPSCYNQSIFRFSFLIKEQKEVDVDFERKIVNAMAQIAATYPDKKEKCISFLEKLRQQVNYTSYKEYITEMISTINAIENDVSNAKACAGQEGEKEVGASMSH